MSAPTNSAASPTPLRTWDPLVKFSHWTIMTLVIINALLVEEGSGWHIWAGYALGALLVLRLLWGLVGPAEARFSAFPPSPARAIRHIGEIRRGEHTAHRSHNPLGAMMVYALWACLAVIVASGVTMAGAPPADPRISEEEREHVSESASLTAATGASEEGEGDEDEEGESVAKEVHEVAVNLLYVLIALHLLGVMFEAHRSGFGIVRAMLPASGGERR